MTLVQAINETLKDEFRHNPDTYIWGQDVAYRDKGGVFNVTKGMQQEFGATRVFNAPDRRGLHPRARPTASRASATDDPRRRRGRGVRRLLLAGGRADGRDVARVLADERPVRPERHRAPRLRRLHRRRPLPLAEHRGLADDAARASASSSRPSPTTPPGLLRTAIRSRGHHALPRAEVPLQQPDGAGERAGGVRGAVRQGARAPRGNGPDDRRLRHARPLRARSRPRRSRRKGRSVEVLDLRSLVPLDFEAIAASVQKTSRVLVAHEDKVHGGFGGEIASQIQESVFQYLDAPVGRVGSAFTPGRLQPDPGARDPPEHREGPRRRQEDPRLLTQLALPAFATPLCNPTPPFTRLLHRRPAYKPVNERS